MCNFNDGSEFVLNPAYGTKKVDGGIVFLTTRTVKIELSKREVSSQFTITEIGGTVVRSLAPADIYANKDSITIISKGPTGKIISQEGKDLSNGFIGQLKTGDCQIIDF
ncbi:MAG: hypothetical protein IPK04_09265 [Bdellovibrionales bacterium]|nr:hypothetical protein [Bdellovibrionales bacterium]